MKEVKERLAALFTELKNPKLNKKNSHFGNAYADLESILSTAGPVVRKHGFRVHQTVAGEVFSTLLVDTQEEDKAVISVQTPFILQSETPQAVGSALTYYRRYGVLLLLNLVGEEDDDAEEAEGRGSRAAGSRRGTRKPKEKKAEKPKKKEAPSEPEPDTGDDDGDEEDW